MASYVALLRGINVGGRKTVAMQELRALCGRAGFTDVQSVLQSGNLVFQSDVASAAKLESQLEAVVRSELDLDVVFLVRSAKEWDKIVAANPFRAEATRDPARLIVMLLKTSVSAAAVAAVQAAIVGREVVRGAGREIYVYYPDGMGRSRLTNAVIEKALATRATARNWNTVLRLQELLKG